MPNWCACELTVRGEAEHIRRFLDHVKSKDREFDFNTLIQYPTEYQVLDDAAEAWSEAAQKLPHESVDWRARPTDGYNQGGKNWCVINWGTKWNACDTTIGDVTVTKRGKAKVKISFNTAWSPPLQIVTQASEDFPELRFDIRYWESGMGFKGRFVCVGGDTIMNLESEYAGSRGG